MNSMRALAKYSWRVVAAALLLTAISVLSYGVRHHFHGFPSAARSAGRVLVLIGLSRLLVTGSLAYLVVRSRWSGTQLMVAVFVAFFGVDSFITQSRAILLPADLVDPSTGALLTAHGFLVGLLFSLVLVVLMGRAHDQALVRESPRLHLPVGEWLLKMGACTVLWVGLYAVLVPREPGEPIWRAFAFETARAVLVIVFVLPAIKMLRGSRLETACAVGATLVALGAVAPMVSRSVLLAEPLSPLALLGCVLANGLYGFAVGYLFSRRASEEPSPDLSSGL